MAVYLNRKISTGQGGLAINGVIENYVVAAGENISAGDFVSFVNNQAVGVLEEISAGDWSDPTFGSEHTFAGVDTTTPNAVQLSDTRVAVTWIVQSAPAPLQGAVLTFEPNGTITQGPTYTLMPGPTYPYDIVKLDVDKFLLVYTQSSTSLDAVLGFVVNVNGNILTPETTYTLRNDAQKPYNPQITALSATKVVVAYGFLLNSTNDVLAVEINGNVLSGGAPVQFSTDTRGNSQTNRVYNVSRLDDNTFIIGYLAGYSTGNYMPTIKIGSVSGTTITLGGPRNMIATPLTSAVAVSVAGISPTKAIVVYDDNAQLLLLSGFNIASFEGFLPFNANGTTQWELTIDEIENDRYYMILFRDDADSENGKAVILTVNGNSLAVTSEYQFNVGDPEYPNYVQINDRQGLIVYEDDGASNDYANAILVTGGAGVPTGEFQQIYEIKGVANEAGTAGETIGVYVPDLTPEV